MEKRHASSVNTTPFCVLELCFQRDRNGSAVVMFASKAGGDDVGAYEWPMAFGCLSPGQFEDIMGRVAGMASTALVTFVPVQGDLGLETSR